MKLRTNSNLLTNICLIPMGVYPTLGSLKEVMDYAESKLPVTNKNEMTAILYTYHNTLLKKITDENNKSDSLSTKTIHP